MVMVVLFRIGTMGGICSLTCRLNAHAISLNYGELTHDLIVNWYILHNKLSEPFIIFKLNARVILEVRLFIQFCHRLSFIIVRIIRSFWFTQTQLWLSKAIHQVLNVIVKLFSCTSRASIFLSLLRSDDITAWSSYTIICNKN